MPKSNFIGGLALTAAAGYAQGAERARRKAELDRALGKTPAPESDSVLSRATKWIGDKLKMGEATPEVAATGGGDDVGLMERLGAGNIDEVGSEAYNRWGAGKASGDAAELTREARRATPAADDGMITKEMFENAPAYAQSNPRWEGLEPTAASIPASSFNLEF